MEYPRTVTPQTYAAIRERMLRHRPTLPTAYRSNLQTYERPDLRHDFSLDRQLSEAAAHEPDIYLFTAYSAIAVADSIRGYYDGRRQTTPALSFIHAHPDSSANLAEDWAGFAESHQKEVRRLGKLVAQKQVCLVDQDVDTGATINYALQTLSEAAAASVSVITGDWYVQMPRIDVRPRQLSSIHQAFFYEVGQRIAQEQGI